MKKISVIAIIAIASLFAACSFNSDSLVGTEWTVEALGSGSGYVFDTATEGHTEIGILGAWGSVSTFTYTYNSLSQTGTISYYLSTDIDETFEISGNTLTVTSVDDNTSLNYDYKP